MKLGGLEPTTWNPYRGVSLLYDPPGCAAVGGIERLERVATADTADRRLYRKLHALTGPLDIAAREAGIGLGLLPPVTYHVTLCDGVHDGVEEQVSPHLNSEVAATLEALPDSLLWSNDVLRALRDPNPRFSVWRDPVTFRVDRLDARGRALVASLAPADAASRRAYSRHEAARSEYAARLQARLGLRTQIWRPHVTLGYLATDTDAARARDTLVPEAQTLLRRHVGDATVTFRSASLHAFTDMATYWRLGH